MDNKNKTPEKKPLQKKIANQGSSGKGKTTDSAFASLAKRIANRVTLTLSKYCNKIVTYTLNIVLTLLLIGIITGSAMACALVVYIKNYVDPVFDIDNLKTDSSLTTFIYYENTKEDGSKEWVEWEDERIHGTENRMWVSYDEMPEDLINAFVSIEDKRFFTHKGIDMKRTIGAVLEFVSGNTSYGGSTITQQLIKNVTGEDDVTIQRKIQEILRALNLESKKLFQQMLGDSTKRLHRLEKSFLVVARYIKGDDSARDIQLDDRILPMTKNAMVNDAVKRLLKGDAKPKLVFREILADYKDIPGAYHDLEALRRQVYRVLRKQA